MYDNALRVHNYFRAVLLVVLALLPSEVEHGDQPDHPDAEHDSLQAIA